MIFEIKQKDAFEFILNALNSGTPVISVFKMWTNSGTAMCVEQDGVTLPITIQIKSDGTWYAMYDAGAAK